MQTRDEDLLKFRLGQNIYAVAHVYQGNTYLQVREYKINPYGNMYPTKTGIAMLSSRFAILHKHLVQITKAAIDVRRGKPDANIDVHLGGGFRVRVSYPHIVVQMRKYYLPDGTKKEQPTKFGITLTFKQWAKLTEAVEKCKALIPAFKDAKPCYEGPDHPADCQECNP